MTLQVIACDSILYSIQRKFGVAFCVSNLQTYFFYFIFRSTFNYQYSLLEITFLFYKSYVILILYYIIIC